MRQLLVSQGAPTEIAVTEDGRLVEYLLDEQRDSLSETILLGKVERVVPGMDAAFVNIGQEKNGFLPLKEMSESFSPLPLQSGQPVIVQIKREAHDQKGAFLSRDITLCGTCVILMPMNRYIGVSGKVWKKEKLKKLGEAIADGRFGLVMRTAAETASPEDVAAEAEGLWETWQEIKRSAGTAHVPSTLHRSETALERLRRDYEGRGGCEVLQGDDKVMAAFRKERDRALERTVHLDRGGTLVIDACEALTAVDVNTGAYTGRHLPSETILQTNLAACRELARQLRLRNIGGVIVVDFIDMDTEEDRQQVMETLEQAVQADRSKVVLHGFTSLGLMELTRKRTGLPLKDVFSAPCPKCGGTGRITGGKE